MDVEIGNSSAMVSGDGDALASAGATANPSTRNASRDCAGAYHGIRHASNAALTQGIFPSDNETECRTCSLLGIFFCVFHSYRHAYATEVADLIPAAMDVDDPGREAPSAQSEGALS